MRIGWLGVAMLVASVAAGAQTTKSPTNTLPEGQQKQCSYAVTDESGNKITGTTDCTPKTAPTDTPVAKKFPYPGDPAPAAPAADSPAAQDPSQKFPFPGDAPANNAGGLKDAGSSGESSSSSSSSNSSSSSSAAPLSPDDVNSDTPPPPKRNLHKKPVATMADKSVADRVDDDLQVGGFYMNDGNWRGAYGRAADAVTLNENDPEAHLMLANAARKLGKLDEAEKHYKLTLKLDPVPKSRKEAERALKEMSGNN